MVARKRVRGSIPLVGVEPSGNSRQFRKSVRGADWLNPQDRGSCAAGLNSPVQIRSNTQIGKSPIEKRASVAKWLNAIDLKSITEETLQVQILSDASRKGIKHEWLEQKPTSTDLDSVPQETSQAHILHHSFGSVYPERLWNRLKHDLCVSRFDSCQTY